MPDAAVTDRSAAAKNSGGDQNILREALLLQELAPALASFAL